MMAAPRCCTTGMKVSSIHFWSTSDFAGLPPTVACERSGYCVEEWLPQMVSLRMSVVWRTGLLGQLRQRAVVIQARHRGEVARVQVLRVGARDQRVGVGGVAHHQHLDVAVGDFVHRLALRGEDRGVGEQQILALHARAARPRARPAAPPANP